MMNGGVIKKKLACHSYVTDTLLEIQEGRHVRFFGVTLIWLEFFLQMEW